MSEGLCGVETEYAFNVRARDGTPLERDRFLSQLLDIARRELVQLPAANGAGMFTANGSRFYVDSGLHPEWSTPECPDPKDVVRYIRAGERTLEDLCSKLRARHRDSVDARLYSSNVDYSGSGSTWGCHESYLHRADPRGLPSELLPHLVTRLIYTGAGGLRRSFGKLLEFTLSPRVAHLIQVTSGDSTFNRGIFHTKNESLARGGFNRLHVICGESLCSDRASWLKIGATALVVALAEAGLEPGSVVALASPLDAMRTIASDPTCTRRVQLGDGRGLTAIEIQRHYLQLVEAHLDREWMPRWAAGFCPAWRDVLGRLERGFQDVDRTLDWAIKYRIYSAWLAARGLSWESQPDWTPLTTAIRETVNRSDIGEPASLESLMSADTPYRAVIDGIDFESLGGGRPRRDFESLLGLRMELFELDTRWGQIDREGLFRQLDATGSIEHRVHGIDRFEDAVDKPPEGSRAAVRGRAIRKLTGARESAADWSFIWTSTEDRPRVLDLSDPFASTEIWDDTSADDDADARLSRFGDPRSFLGMRRRRRT